MHGVLVSVNLVGQSNRVKSLNLKYSLTFIAMLSYVFVILMVAQILYELPVTHALVSDYTTIGIVTWMRIELCVWLGIIASNILFMIGRSFGKMYLDASVGVDENNRLSTIDTIVATNSISAYLHNETIPLFVSYFL